MRYFCYLGGMLVWQVMAGLILSAFLMLMQQFADPGLLEGDLSAFELSLLMALVLSVGNLPGLPAFRFIAGLADSLQLPWRMVLIGWGLTSALCFVMSWLFMSGVLTLTEFWIAFLVILGTAGFVWYRLQIVRLMDEA